MALLKCKMCGGDLEIIGNQSIVECDYCNTRQTVPSADDEKRVNLYNRANKLRISGQFDKAAGLYESIIAEFPEEAEAYWGLCLCNYGIEYVDDPATGKKIPTCHRASFDSLLRDDNFNMALENSDVVVRKVYIDQAKEIDSIMNGILAVSKNEKPYDVFICYKETDEYGQRTIDSVLAQDIYDRLTEKGLKVFFARITLEDKLGRQYEPYIFAALNSAKVMLSIGTRYEYFHAVWVENEWSRFLKLMAKDRDKVLIPCYKDIAPEDMPVQFRALQAQDMGKIGFMQDLIRGVMKIVGENKPVAPQQPAPQRNVQVNRPAANSRAPIAIKYIHSMGAMHQNDHFPKTGISANIDMSTYPCVAFNIFTGRFPYAGKVNLRMIIKDGGGNTITDSASDIEVNTTHDKLARTWILRGTDGSSVSTGSYTAIFSVNGGPAMEYRFTVLDSRAAQNMYQPTTPGVYQPTTPVVPAQQVYFAGGKKPNLFLYLILCFWLGMFGVHSFYAKQIKKGVIQLALSWTGISVFWAMIDFFKALFTRKVK